MIPDVFRTEKHGEKDTVHTGNICCLRIILYENRVLLISDDLTENEHLRRRGHRLCREEIAMKFYYVTFRSVTFAQRGEQVLQKEGIRCTLLRTPKWMEKQGCGYSLRFWTDDVRPALQVMRKNQVPLRKVYLQTRDGQLEEWTQ